ncbi:uncharacterized protein N7482_005152 [Penicillium canariense]|uniref:Uncharacterized protein n=1 Tax=Penicillium canariense TaxID=189055 RepID=A0A9W9I1Z2_9EURO|nr:uncharacterized protein N7482_005152 [Penicillium canariense]KAJ5166371.1 hypothetical protein N7482_005152 [Penicillium canariense]
MDEHAAVNGLLSIPLSVVSALFGIVTVLFSYTWSVLYLLASPLVYLGHGLLALVLFPVQVLLKFEAFLTFVAGAVFTGVTVGLCLYFAGDSLTQLLRLQPSSAPSFPTDLVDPKDPPFDWESRMFMSSTILEEEENSQDSTPGD